MCTAFILAAMYNRDLTPLLMLQRSVFINKSNCSFHSPFTATGQEKEAAKQIFTSSAASGILTNDLVKIMEEQQVREPG